MSWSEDVDRITHGCMSMMLVALRKTAHQCLRMLGMNPTNQQAALQH